MKKLFKLFAAAAAVAMLCVSFAGCNFRGQPGSNPGEELTYEIDFNIPASTTAEISVLIPNNDYEKGIMDAMTEGFRLQYPNITFDIKTFSLTSGSYNNTVTMQYNAGVLPDIVWCNSENFYFLMSGGYALNLDRFVEQAEAAGEFDYEQDFTDKFHGMGVFGESRYAIPRSADTVVCFYNKEILADAGVDTSIIKNGWTWNDFLTVCQQVRDYYDGQGDTSYFPIDSNLGWEPVAYSVIRSFGGQVLNEQGEFALTQDTAGEVVDFVQNLVDRKFIPESGEQDSSFESGTGAMLFQSTSLDNYANRAIFQDDSGNPIFDIVSFPLINGQSSSIGMGYAGYALNSHLDDEGADPMKLNLAAAFLSYMMSQDGQQRAAEGGLTLPSIRTDLSYSNPDANWHKEYSSKFNLEAYTWGSDYKTAGLDFLGYTDPVFSSSLISAMDSFVGTYAVRDPENAFTRFREEVQYAFDSVVTA